MFRSIDHQRCQALFQKYYGARKFHDALYRETIREHVRAGQHILDAGCGRYLKFCLELSDVAHVIGVDLEPVLETDNSISPFGVRGDVNDLPFRSAYFDVVISRSVIEHLQDPGQVFGEFFRVLKPGGNIVVITPNKYDYVSLIAAVTPYRLHRALVSRIFKVSADDVFPTMYRANTISSLRKSLRAAGFVGMNIDAINHYPAYLSFSPVLYRLGILYERLTSTKLLKGLRSSLLCVAQKPGATGERDTKMASSETSASEPVGVS